MIKTLAAGAIGVKVASLEDGIQKCSQFGFDGLEFDVRDVARRVSSGGASSVSDLFGAAGIAPAAFGLTVEWRRDSETWEEGLAELPALAKAAAAIGCKRTATWVMPGSNDREFDENWQFHIDRFKPIAEIFAGEGISLGLEFIGPKTLRDTQKHAFVYKLGHMLDLAKEIGPNVGLLADAYHWHTGRGTLDDLRTLNASDVVYVHINDAIAGVPTDELMDGTRRLPGETGVIDLRGFIDALYGIGYTGPVAVEPFKKELNDLPTDDDRLRLVSESLAHTVDR